MTQVGAPAVGEVLADRYRLEEHIHDDSTGRQVWRGVDVILRRAVTIVLKYPGGADAEDMLQAAVAASRVVHPHTVGVYDAVDEGERAYVVREYVDGRSLRDIVQTDGPLSAERATAVAHAIADALAAVHETGVAHGNVHPGTVLLGGLDDRIVLADARAGSQASPEADVRGLGGVLYTALTGYWPEEVPGDYGLPAAPRAEGKLAAPRQVRPGVPNYLDALTMDLLDDQLPPPSAAELSAELGRLNVANEVSGPLDLVTVEPPSQQERKPIWKKLAVGIAALAAISLVGLLIGTTWVNSNTNDGGGPDGSQTNQNTQAAAPSAIAPAGVRVVDPKGGDRTELDGAKATTDASQTTYWRTQAYNEPQFGRLKDGMGILLDLGKDREIQTVSVVMTDGGATMGLKMGGSDPADGGSGTEAIDTDVMNAFKQVPGAEQQQVQVTKSWTLSGVKTRYLMVWITKLPQNAEGKYQVGIKDIKVRGQ
ncbi:MAG TPA: protein kinase family protein [Actinocatenispora sp.]